MPDYSLATLGAFRNGVGTNPGAICPVCPDRGSVVCDAEQGDYVCIECGLVLNNSQIVADICTLPPKWKEATYLRAYHFSERMRQWHGLEPPIPQPLLDLILLQAHFGNYEQSYQRDTIRSLLRDIRVPYYLREQFRSLKFKRQELKNMKRFYEKWVKIQSILTNERVVMPDHLLVRQMRSGFLAMQAPFERIRHAPQCDGRKKCNKTFGCRHNFPNTNFIITKLIQRYGGDSEYQRWKAYFPPISASKVKALETMWQKMTDQERCFDIAKVHKTRTMTQHVLPLRTEGAPRGNLAQILAERRRNEEIFKMATHKKRFNRPAWFNDFQSAGHDDDDSFRFDMDVLMD